MSAQSLDARVGDRAALQLLVQGCHALPNLVD
jgi:hypothetical protein